MFCDTRSCASSWRRTWLRGRPLIGWEPAQTFFCSINLSFIFDKEMNFASQVTFTTDSDCEVLLHLYKEYGPHFLKKVKQIWIVPPSHHLYSYIWFYKSDKQASPHKFRKKTRKEIRLHFSRFLWTGCLHLFFMTLAGTSSSLQGIQWVFTYLIFVIFFTQAKFLENEIYTVNCQFFALNLKKFTPGNLFLHRHRVHSELQKETTSSDCKVPNGTP